MTPPSKQCRLCLSPDKTKSKYLFKENASTTNSSSYSDRIFDVLNVELDYDTNLPQLSCGVCIAFIDNVVKFRKIIINTHQLLYHSIKSCKEARILETCRLCNVPCKEPGEVNLFVKRSCGTSLADQMLDILNVQFENSPRWPGSCCLKCVGFLREILSFRENVIDSQKKLQSSNSSEMNQVKQTEDACLDIKDSIVVPQSEPDFSDLDDDFSWPETHLPPETVRKKRPWGGIIRRTPEELAELRKVVEALQILNCRECDWLCKDLSDLKMHVRQNHDPETYEYCCNMKLARNWEMLDHVLLHVDKDAFKCKSCDSAFQNRADLHFHKKEHHPVAPNSMVCELCGKVLTCRSMLKKHMEMKHTESRYKCTYCDKDFSTRYIMKHHVRMKHKLEENSNYICEVCGQFFPTISSVNGHVRYHGGPRAKPKKKKQKLFREEPDPWGGERTE